MDLLRIEQKSGVRYSIPVLLHSPLLFLDKHLRIHGRGTDRTNVPPRCFIEIRFANLLTVWTSDNERFFFFRHCLASIVMVCRFQTFGSGQFADERFRIVNQHREMLRTYPEFLILIFQHNQRYLFSRAAACDALWFFWMCVGHNNLSMMSMESTSQVKYTFVETLTQDNASSPLMPKASLREGRNEVGSQFRRALFSDLTCHKVIPLG